MGPLKPADRVDLASPQLIPDAVDTAVHAEKSERWPVLRDIGLRSRKREQSVCNQLPIGSRLDIGILFIAFCIVCRSDLGRLYQEDCASLRPWNCSLAERASVMAERIAAPSASEGSPCIRPSVRTRII